MSDDAQREMEQRALRNVRGLVDTIQTQESANRRSAKRIVVWSAIAIAVAIGFLVMVSRMGPPRPEAKIVTIPPQERQAPAPRAP